MIRRASNLHPVLVIDVDPGHRRLIAMVLERAGFKVTAVPDAATATDLLEEFAYCAVVRDLDFALARRERALEQLLSTPREILRRTVITTTAAARALNMIGPDKVFAVIGKPFQVAELVDAVHGCAQSPVDPALPAVACGAAREEASNSGEGQDLAAR
jgi:DNA-binding NtrC family response regulator